MLECKVCGKAGDDEQKLLKCSVCLTAFYCSTQCQRDDFISHKPPCKTTGILSLFKAIEENDEDTVRRLAKTKYILNGKIDYTPTDVEDAGEMRHWTALHECIRQDNTQMMQILIDTSNAKLEIKDGDGETPLFLAATNTHPEPLRLLLTAGADPNPTARDGWSALMMAVRDGNYENTEALLEAGADIDAGSDMFGRKALDIAVMQSTGQGIRMSDGESHEQAMERHQRVHELLSNHLRT